MNEELIKNVESFDELYRVIKKVGEDTFGIGEMLIYDSAERIGNYKNLFPQKIYLHAGTRVGSEKLLKRKIKTEAITKNQLPEEFDLLTCSEIEDILCMYKTRLSIPSENSMS